MNKFDRKRLNKMYEKIDSIAKQGKIGLDEYKEFLDEIVSDGQYWIFQNMLARKYGLKNTGGLSVVDAKAEKIYNEIRIQTNSTFQKELKKIYSVNSVYQIGKKVYSTTNNTILGEIYQQAAFGNNQAIIVDTVIAVKGVEVMTYDDTTISLINKYKSAVEFIAS